MSNKYITALFLLLMSTNVVCAMKASHKEEKQHADINASNRQEQGDKESISKEKVEKIREEIRNSKFVQKILGLLNNNTKWKDYLLINMLIFDAAERTKQTNTPHKLSEELKNALESGAYKAEMDELEKKRQQALKEKNNEDIEAFTAAKKRTKVYKAYPKVLQAHSWDQDDHASIQELKKEIERELTTMILPYWKKKIGYINNHLSEKYQNFGKMIVFFDELCLNDWTIEEYSNRFLDDPIQKENSKTLGHSQSKDHSKPEVPALAWVVIAFLVISNLVFGYLYFSSGKKEGAQQKKYRRST